MSEASGKFWVNVYFFNVSDCCSSINLNAIICVFLSWFSLFEQQLFSGKWGNIPLRLPKTAPPPSRKDKLPNGVSAAFILQSWFWSIWWPDVADIVPSLLILQQSYTTCESYIGFFRHSLQSSSHQRNTLPLLPPLPSNFTNILWSLLYYRFV